MTTMAITGSERKVIKRFDVVAISGLGLNDSAFAEGGDSGSIYYATRGTFRYPFAIHNGEGYDKMDIVTPQLFPNPKDKDKAAYVTRKVYYGTPLRYALNKLASDFDDADFVWLDKISMVAAAIPDSSSTVQEET